MAHVFFGHADVLFLWEPTPWAISSTPSRHAIAHRGGLLQKTHPLNVVKDFSGPDQQGSGLTNISGLALADA
jgi:hypothetical protein